MNNKIIATTPYNEQLEIEGYQAYCLVTLLKFNDIVWGATNDFT